jgi:hypothetical protein
MCAHRHELHQPSLITLLLSPGVWLSRLLGHLWGLYTWRNPQAFPACLCPGPSSQRLFLQGLCSRVLPTRDLKISQLCPFSAETPLVFRRHRLDDPQACPRWLGHSGACTSLGKPRVFPHTCSKPGLPPSGFTTLAVPHYSCFQGTGPLRLLLQGLCPSLPIMQSIRMIATILSAIYHGHMNYMASHTSEDDVIARAAIY